MLAVKAVSSGIQQISHVPSVQNICVDSINKHLVSTDRTTLRKLLLLSGPQYLYLKNGQVKTQPLTFLPLPPCFASMTIIHAKFSYS